MAIRRERPPGKPTLSDGEEAPLFMEPSVHRRRFMKTAAAVTGAALAATSLLGFLCYRHRDRRLHNLELMMNNCGDDRYLDFYAPNTIIGPHLSFWGVSSGEYDGEEQVCYNFVPTGEQSARMLPRRHRDDYGRHLSSGEELRQTQGESQLAHAINVLTNLSPAKPDKIADYVVWQYKTAYGIDLDPAAVDVIPKPDEEGIADVRYTGANKDAVIETLGATLLAHYMDEPTARFQGHDMTNRNSHRMQVQTPLTSNGSLMLPPSIPGSDESLYIPKKLLREYEQSRFRLDYATGGGEPRNIEVVIPLKEFENQLLHYGRIWANEPVIQAAQTNYPDISKMVSEDDPVLAPIAARICSGLATNEERAQTLLNFAHRFHYIMDRGAEKPRFPAATLMCKGGDCEDTAILYAGLLMAAGMDPLFLYYPSHLIVGVPGEFFEHREGQQIGHFEVGGLKYFPAEHTGEGWRIGMLPEGYGEPDVVQRVRTGDVYDLQRR